MTEVRQPTALEIFGRHIPRILRHQLLSKLVDQYLFLGERDDICITPTPSIERFHGSLLFVDISGFTVLSQKLGVEDLKTQINAYFKKIMDIIDKYDGEVVKFAGDALFIIWQTKTNAIDTSEAFLKASKLVLHKAVYCGVEINQNCSNYMIDLDPKKTKAAENKSDKTKTPEPLVTYLNVHSGVSAGLMAGIDVGLDDRWEYLLLGDPLSDVAGAESEAGQGELVISPGAHEILHPKPKMSKETALTVKPQRQVAQTGGAELAPQPPCGCLRTPKGFFVIKLTVPKSGSSTAGGNSTTGTGSGNANTSTNTSASGGGVTGADALMGMGKTTVGGFGSPGAKSVTGRRPSSPGAGVSVSGIRVANSTAFAGTPGGRISNASLASLYYVDIATLTVPPKKGNEIRQVFDSIYPIISREYIVQRDIASAELGQVEYTGRAPSNAWDEETALDKRNDAASSGGMAIGSNKHSPVVSLVSTPRALGSEGGTGTQHRKSLPSQAAAMALSTARHSPRVPRKNLKNAQSGTSGEVDDDFDSNMGRGSTRGLDAITELKFWKHFGEWATSCLVDDVARHVHEAARTKFKLRYLPRDSLFFNYAGQQAATNVRKAAAATAISPSGSTPSGSTPPASVFSSEKSSGNVPPEQSVPSGNFLSALGFSSNDPAKKYAESAETEAEAEAEAEATIIRSEDTEGNSMTENTHSFVNKLRNMTQGVKGGKDDPKKSKGGDIGSDSSAELRNVIVMFIKISMPDLELFVDSTQQRTQLDPNRSKVDDFFFLRRSIIEANNDAYILKNFQDCMAVMSRTLVSKGGQMRQLICDDKGTVAIATFGLRGAVNYDNAAASIEAANIIIYQLGLINMVASIGITSGKGYCGLVGSPTRHEYAVMGPSINLSARLMCKAGPREAMCDHQTRLRDRTHSYMKLKPIIAKGYSQPVDTFRPVIRASIDATHAKRRRSSINGSFSDIQQALENAQKAGGSSFHTYSQKMGIQPIGTPGSMSAEDISGEQSAISIAATVTHSNVKALGTQGTLSGKKQSGAASSVAKHMKKPNYKMKNIQGRTGEMKILLDSVNPFSEATCAFLETALKFFNDVMIAENPVGIEDHHTFNSDVAVHAKYSNKTKDSVEEEEDEQVVTVSSVSTAHFRPLFNPMKQKCLMVLVQGPHGSGKTCFMDNFVTKLMDTQRIAPIVFNVTICKNRASSVSNLEPFSAWVPILRQVLLASAEEASNNTSGIHNVPMGDQQPSNVDPARAVRATNSITSQTAEAVQAKDHLLGKSQAQQYREEMIRSEINRKVQKMPAELRKYCFLLRACNLLHAPVDTEGENCDLSPSQRIQITAELIATLFQLSVQESNKLFVVVLDDLQFFDVASWQLLEKIYMTNMGILLLAAHKLSKSNVGIDRFAVFQQDPQHFQSVEMGVLDLPSIKNLALSIFSSNHLTDIDESVYDTIYIMSGGNPLFAFELAKIACENCLATYDPTTETYATMKIDFSSLRIEEVICHRFDQLESVCQLVLKMSSVCCLNNSFFTVYMLAFIMNDGGTVRHNSKQLSRRISTFKADAGEPSTAGSSTTEIGATSPDDATKKIVALDAVELIATLLSNGIDLVAVMNYIIKRDEFVKIVGLIPEGDSHSVVDTISVEEEKSIVSVSGAVGSRQSNGDMSLETLLSLAFSFGVTVEKNTIYNLMLDDQKEYIHESVALYMESRQGTFGNSGSNGDTSSVSTSLLIEEAFHLERAKSWAPAMEAYYRAALQMELYNSPRECTRNLLSAFVMLERIRDNAAITGPRFNVQEVLDDFGISDVEKLSDNEDWGGNSAKLLNMPSTSQKSDAGLSVKVDMTEHAVSTKLDVYTMFEGDTAQLERGIGLLVKLGYAHLKLGVNKLVTTKIFCEALQLIKLTTTAESLALRQSHTANVGKVAHAELFGVNDVSIFFPLLTSVQHLLHRKTLLDDAQCSISKMVCEVFAVLAASNARYTALKVTSCCLWRNYFLEIGDLKSAFRHAEKVLFTYQFAAHSKMLTKLYPFDSTVLMLVLDLQLRVLLGMFDSMTEYLSYFEEVLPTMKHLNTLAMTSIPLCAFFISMERYTQARDVLTIYMDTGDEQQAGTKHFQHVIPIIETWVSVTATLGEWKQVGAAEDAMTVLEGLRENTIVQNMLSQEYLFTLAHRPAVYTELEEFCDLSMEYVCAHTLYSIACMMSFLPDISTDTNLQDLQARHLAVALTYTEFISENCEGGPFFEATLLLLIANIQFMVMLVHSAIYNSIHKSQVTVDSAFKKLTTFAASGDYHMLTWWTGILFDAAKSGEATGKTLRMAALGKMKLLSTDDSIAEVLNLAELQG